MLTPQQYRWLMEGLQVKQPKAHKKVTGLILEQLMEQIWLSRHKRFGASSEKNTEAEQLSIFNEAEIYEDAEKAEEKLTVVAGHTRRKRKNIH